MRGKSKEKREATEEDREDEGKDGSGVFITEELLPELNSSLQGGGGSHGGRVWRG